MATLTAPTMQHIRDADLCRLIDRSVARAMFDAEFATRMLADPTVVLGDSGCTPQQRRDLRTIHADTVLEFAERARDRFWLQPVERVYRRDVPLSAAAI